mgnify:CR=1 FL=1|jgi:hypothetical protein
MMCKDETAKPARCGKNSFRLIGKPKTYFKGTTMVDFKPIEKTYDFDNSAKRFKKRPSFQHLTRTINTSPLHL